MLLFFVFYICVKLFDCFISQNIHIRMMKTIKIIALTVLVAFAGITKAQQPINTTTSIESTKPDTIAPTLLTEEQKRLQEQALLKANLEAEKAAQKAEKERLKAEKELQKRQKQVEKQAKKLEKQQKAREKAAKKYDKALKKANKLESNIKKQASKIEKMEDALDKKIRRNRISDIDREKEIIKISKQQIKLKELERDFEKAERDVKKLR